MKEVGGSHAYEQNNLVNFTLTDKHKKFSTFKVLKQACWRLCSLVGYEGL